MSVFEQRAALADIFGAILRKPTRLGQAEIVIIRGGLRRAIEKAGLKWEAADWTRLPDRIKGMKDAKRVQVIYDYTTGPLRRLLSAGDTIPRTDKSENVLRLIDTMRERQFASEQSIEEMLVSLRYILRFFDDDHMVDKAFCKRYFGYRRSANAGEMIHFYLCISATQHPGIVRFENRFKRDRQFWTAEGFGLQINHTLFMVGNAHSGKGYESRGLRFFALQRYGDTECLVGPLISMDRTNIPIAARVVLIPVYLHNGFGEDLTEESIMSFVNLPRSENKIINSLGKPFVSETNDVLRRLIDNSTATVLRGKPYENPRFARAVEQLLTYATVHEHRSPEEAFIEVMECVMSKRAAS